MHRIDLETFSPWPQDAEGIDELLHSIFDRVQNLRDVTFHGNAPAWLCMLLGHFLGHTLASLHFETPDMGTVEVFDHNPF